jgi:hypothetical protein
MKKRRIVVVALMLVAVICVGVGYALTSDAITLNGSVKYTPEFILQWKDANVTGESISGTPSVNAEKTELSFTVDASEWSVNDSKTYTATVTNPSKYAGNNLRVLTGTVTGTCFTVTASPNGTDITVGGDQTVTITIKMTALPTTSAEYTETFTFEIVADQVTGA